MANVTVLLSLLLAASLIAAGTWAAHHAPFRQDRHHYEYMGMCIAAGRPIYAGCWDNKPPLLPWINAGILALTNGSTEAVTVAGGMAAAVTAGGAAFGAWIVFGRAVGCAIALLAAGTVSLRFYDGCTNGMDQCAAMFQSIAALALVLACRGGPLAATLGSFAAGLFFAAAVATKQFAVAAPAAVLLTGTAAAVLRRDARGQLIFRLLVGLFGFCAGLAAVGWVLWKQGVLGEAYYASVTFNRYYVQQKAAWVFFPTARHARELYNQLPPIALPIWLSLLAIVAAAASAFRHKPAEAQEKPGLPAGLILFSLWLLLAAYCVIWGPAHETRYWFACFVPLFWLAAQGLHFVFESLQSGDRASRAVAAVSAVTVAWLLAAPVAWQQYRGILSTFHYARDDSERSRLRQIAAAIQHRTADHDEIYVWGYEPGIYRFSERLAPCRFSGIDKVEHFGAAAQWIVDEIADALEARPPRLIVVPAHTLDAAMSGRQCQADVSRFRDLLVGSYRRDRDIHGFILFERLEAIRAAPASADG